MKVYIVKEVIQYEGSSVCGVFDSKLKADECAALLTDLLETYQTDYSYNVSEWELR